MAQNRRVGRMVIWSPYGQPNEWAKRAKVPSPVASAYFAYLKMRFPRLKWSENGMQMWHGFVDEGDLPQELYTFRSFKFSAGFGIASAIAGIGGVFLYKRFA